VTAPKNPCAYCLQCRNFSARDKTCAVQNVPAQEAIPVCKQAGWREFPRGLAPNISIDHQLVNLEYGNTATEFG